MESNTERRLVDPVVLAPRVTVGGIKIAQLDIEQTARLMMRIALAEKCVGAPLFFTSVNGEILARRWGDPAFAELIDHADLISADGQPLVFASRLLTKKRLPERVATTDLYPAVARRAQAQGVSFYLFGACEEANRAAYEATRRVFPRLNVLGRSHGYLSGEALERKVDEINALAPDILWVAMGAPLEHEFVRKWRERLGNVKVIKTSGGLFDFVAGAKSRAPIWVQKAGFEWAYRLWLEPRRLFIRYASTNPLALMLLARTPFEKEDEVDMKQIAKKVVLIQTQAENAGAQELSRQLAASLRKKGWATRQIFFYRRTSSFDNEQDVVFCSDARPSSPFGVLKLMWRLYAELRRDKPDAVITFQHYGNLIAAPIARLAGAPLIIANQVSSKETNPPLARMGDRLIGLLGAYDYVVVNSASAESAYAGYPVEYRKRLVRIEHGVRDKVAAFSKSEARLALELPREVPLLGCAARLHPLKRLDLAIEILAINSEQHLAIAGQGPELAHLQALARELSVEDRVHFLGELDVRLMGLFLAALDCFVFPSCSETFGIAPVEAAQAGVPVIANSLKVLKEVLAVEGEPCALFVDACDTPSFAQMVKNVIDDGELRALLSAKGRRLKERYPLDKMVRGYLNLIEPEGQPA